MSTNFEDLILRDTFANRPAAGVPGRLFYDTTNEKWQRDNGSAWQDCEPGSGGGAGSDTTAIHDDTAGEIHAVTEKTTPASADVLLIEDSADSYNKKRLQVGNLPSGGGVGAAIYESAYASPPASPNSGDLWRVTDAPIDGRYNGSAWVYRWYGIPVTIPSGSGWTWFNQGSATLTDLGIQRIIAPTGSSGDQMRGVVKSVTAPYNVYMRIRGFYPFNASSGYGICARQSSDGKLKVLSYQTANAHTISAEKWNSPTSWNSNILNPVSNLQEFTAFADLLYRISDDSTNFSISLSPDNGTTWSTVWNETRTTFATCDQVGFFAYTNSSSYYAMCELAHWVVT